ncbi:SusE domain-containing protein [Sphingobacterium sp. SYP-B4668]|uniref:SusE domain-containing protein n=1 Tax=Sphingobacterium sp. SYP-B4668 TaxID=2996035 RepID=UPI0022DE156E|nr:SusE domain-containing protein [Sphingobacterium sp. SYP-B4668]
MKHIYILLLALLFMTNSCKEEVVNHMTTLSDVILLAPESDTFIDIDPKSNAVVRLHWQKSIVADGTLAFYSILFDKESGDFSNPVRILKPLKQGVEQEFILSHQELNRIASDAGIPELGAGKLKWTVQASNGVNQSPKGASFILQVKRPSGFARNPEQLFLSGTGTEAGANLQNGIPLRKISDGIFEVYTSLDQGSLVFHDGQNAQAVTYIMDGNAIKAGEKGVSPVSKTTVLKLQLNFNQSVTQLTEILEVGVWFSGFNRVTHGLAYESKGVWALRNAEIAFSQQSWGKDERYKFRLREKGQDNVVKTYYLGSSKKDNSKPSSSTEASYFYLFPVENSQWDYTYKFMRESGNADILLDFNASANSTHKVEYR